MCITGQQGSAFRQFQHLVLVAGQQSQFALRVGNTLWSVPVIDGASQPPALRSTRNRRPQAVRNQLVAKTHADQFLALRQQPADTRPQLHHPGLVRKRVGPAARE